MTLTEALSRLHAAGEIASPWLPGMATGDDGCVRILEIEHQGIPGLIRVADDEGAAWVWPWPDRQCPQPGHDYTEIGEPCLSDHATVGCLLALLREASGDPEVVLTVSRSRGLLGKLWLVWGGGKPRIIGTSPSEGEAIAAALIDLAGAP